MPDSSDKTENNVAGAYYVDSQCIACGVCTGVAADNFGTNGDGTAYVSKQPDSDDDKAACEEAIASCPVDAIGTDG